MKNISRILMAVAVLFTASCAKEDISSSIGGGEVEMTFTVDLPELGTRAYADGAKATALRYYVYDDVDDNYLSAISSESLPEKKVTLVDGKAVVTLPLLKGMTYNIIFWADNGSNIYTIDPATKVLTVDYTNAKANDDSRDAFYKYLTDVDPTNATKIKEQAKVTLTRPFGQLNAATSDFEDVKKNEVTLTTSALTVTANTTLNLATGIAGTPKEINFAATAMPCTLTPDKETLKSGYEYLSMNYLLPGNVNAKYSFNATKGGQDFTFTGTSYNDVPVKANYRTNILGKLLTATTDFTVTIEAEFNKPAEIVATDAFSLQEAINNAVDGEQTQITLGSDIDLSENLGLSSTRAVASYGIVVPAEKNIILNLVNGINLYQSKKQTAAYSMIQNNGTLTIKGNGTISYTDTGNGGEYVSNTILNSGTLTIENCTIENNSSADVANNGYPQVIDNNKELTINSGKLDCKNYASIRIWCTTDDDTKVTINGGTFIGSVDLQNVNGNANKGVLNIHGGEFTHSTYNDKAIRLVNFGEAIENLEINIYNAVVNGALGLGGANKNVDLAEVLTVYGGTFSTDPSAYVADGCVANESEDGLWEIVKAIAKVGNTEYGDINKAIAAWANNTTLTLLADVTLSDVITLKSTEHHILDLSTYTMTAADGKNAIEIKACGTGAAERYAITIKADETNPGGINAGKKMIIYYKYADGGITTEDRPIIKIEGGVFTGPTASFMTYGIYTIGSAARKCATLNISGGIFNCSIYGSGKSKLLIYGGVFNYSVGSQGDSTANRLISGGKFKTFGFMTADSNNTKFWFGTEMGNSNVGIYVDDEGYFVVGGPVITEYGDKFEAKLKAANVNKASTYLQYSSAATYGLYYTSAEVAKEKHNNNLDKVEFKQ